MKTWGGRKSSGDAGAQKEDCLMLFTVEGTPEQAQAPKEKGTTTTTGTKGTWSYIPEEVPAVVTPSGQPASKELSPAERQRARALKNEELWRR